MSDSQVIAALGSSTICPQGQSESQSVTYELLLTPVRTEHVGRHLLPSAMEFRSISINLLSRLQHGGSALLARPPAPVVAALWNRVARHF
jgi:hypothetical protein